MLVLRRILDKSYDDVKASPDNKVFVLTTDHRADLYNIKDNVLIKSLKTGYSASFSPNMKYLLLKNNSGKFTLLDGRTYSEIYSYKFPYKAEVYDTDAVFSKDDEHIFLSYIKYPKRSTIRYNIHTRQAQEIYDDIIGPLGYIPKQDCLIGSLSIDGYTHIIKIYLSKNCRIEKLNHSQVSFSDVNIFFDDIENKLYFEETLSRDLCSCDVETGEVRHICKLDFGYTHNIIRDSLTENLYVLAKNSVVIIGQDGKTVDFMPLVIEDSVYMRMGIVDRYLIIMGKKTYFYSLD